MLLTAYYERKILYILRQLWHLQANNCKRKPPSCCLFCQHQNCRKRNIFSPGDYKKVLQNTLNLFPLCSREKNNKPRSLKTHIRTLCLYLRTMSSSHSCSWLSHAMVLELRIIFAAVSGLEAQLLQESQHMLIGTRRGNWSQPNE